MFNRMFKTWEGTSWEMSQGMANFMAGGLASNLYWLSALRESWLETSARRIGQLTKLSTRQCQESHHG